MAALRRFAKAGYYAIAQDLYQRQGDATKVSDFKALVTNIVGRTPDTALMTDLDSTLAFVRHDGGNTTRNGITGLCWGGRIVWLCAAHHPILKAGVAWYGRLTGTGTPLQPNKPIDLVASISAPVSDLYGGLDKGIAVTDVDRMNGALNATGKPSSLPVFSRANHGFLADYRPSYNEAAANERWTKALAWFERYL